MLGCDVVRLQEMLRPGRIEFAAASYRVFCSGEDGSSGWAGQHGVGLATKVSIIRKATWTQKLTNERLITITFILTGKSLSLLLWHMARQILTVPNTREQKDAF